MPEKYRLQLRNVQNVAASKTALIDCPIGPRYHYIVLLHGYASGTNTIAAACTNISEIRVKVNGRVQRVFSGTQLRDLNILNGPATQYDCTGVPNTAPGVSIPLYFAEPWLTDELSQDALAWKTNLWKSFQIEVDISSASTPTLSAFAVVDNLVSASQEGINKILHFSSPAGSTSFDITTLDARDFLRSLHIYQDSGGSNTPSEIDFRKNGNVLHELTYAANAALLNNYMMLPTASGRTSGIYDVVFDHDGLLSSAVDMNGANTVLTVKSASAMSGTTTFLAQRVGPPE